jgi:TIR domain-containing protein
MADVFISYSKPHAAITRKLADELEAKGLSVWWDTDLLAGETFRDRIVEELKACKAAIVIWTPQSVKSAYVISEHAAINLAVRRPDFAKFVGYAYRLGTARHVGIGLVGRGECLHADLALTLRGATFLCEDMPALASMKQGATSISSVQWSIAGHAVLAGDAAIARDALSSQGLAASLSDSLSAVAAIASERFDCLHLRQAENLTAHLRLLKEQIARSRYREKPLWQAYDRFINERMVDFADSRAASAISQGRIEELPLSA